MKIHNVNSQFVNAILLKNNANVEFDENTFQMRFNFEKSNIKNV